MLLLDVREAWEVSLASVPGALHIPMNEIPSRLGELEPGQELIVMCKSGGRSLSVAEYLNQNGFAAVFNLTGGIMAWSEEVDPSVPAY